MKRAKNGNIPVVENLKLQYAGQFANLVHGLGANEKPSPYQWLGWKLILLNGAWVYHNQASGEFISPDKLHAMMGGVAQEHVDHTPSGYAKTALSSGWGILVGLSLLALWPEIHKVVVGRKH